jgi:hypothetical protein
MRDLLGGEGLWDDAEGFYYDVLHTDGERRRMKVRSLVGLIPLFAVETLEPEVVDTLPGFKRRMQWFIENHPEFGAHLVEATRRGRTGVRRLLSIVTRDQLPRVLRLMLDEGEFLSPHGIRSVSRFHADHPYLLHLDGIEHRVDYEPAESGGDLFGGNSNWRGPVWFPSTISSSNPCRSSTTFTATTSRYPVRAPPGRCSTCGTWPATCRGA